MFELFYVFKLQLWQHESTSSDYRWRLFRLQAWDRICHMAIPKYTIHFVSIHIQGDLENTSTLSILSMGTNDVRRDLRGIYRNRLEAFPRCLWRAVRFGGYPFESVQCTEYKYRYWRQFDGYFLKLKIN